MGGPGAQSLTPWVFLPGIGLIFLGFALFTRAGRLRLPLRPLVAGMGLWPGAQALLFLIPLNPLLVRWAMPQAGPVPSAFWIFKAAASALVEVGVVWTAVRHSKLRAVDWKGAYALGLGFASIALIVEGILELQQAIWLTVIQTGAVKPEMQEILHRFAAFNNPGVGLATLVDGMVNALVHILACAWVVYGLRSGHAKWLVNAFVFKLVLYAFLGYAQYWFGLDTPWKIGQAEMVMMVYGAFAWRALRPLPVLFGRLTDVPKTGRRG